MRTLRALDSGWELDAVAPVPESPAARLPAAIPAVVPGVVHTDLLRAGLIPDPYLETNEASLAWIGGTRWRYRCRFDAETTSDELRELVFDGLDTVASVSLNGTEIGRTRNQHRSYCFDVTAQLRGGTNLLEVVFESARVHASEVEALLGPLPNVYPAPFNFVRKSACNFGWDWGPDVETAGIWRPVRLESGPATRIDTVRVAVSVPDGVPRADVVIEIAGASESSGLTVSARVNDIETTVPVIDGSARLTFDVPGAELWWPRGLGAQPLHDLRVTLADDDGPLDEALRRVGFRHVELDTSADDEGTAFTVVVNGLPVFIRGANWIPDDCFPSRVTPDRYQERIEQAVQANVNLLRVWGGGVYEADAFYETCDRLGVMVWQDFLFACAAYPEEEPVRGEILAEAAENVIRLSPHPSLVLWCGSNENIMGWFDWPWQDTIGDRTWGAGYYLELLPALIAELAPTTPYWASSPYSGSMSLSANDPRHATIHIWDVWNEVDWRHYSDYSPRFVSEFGFQGPPTWSTLVEAVSDRSTSSPAMRSHQKAEDGAAKLAAGLEPHLPEPRSTEEWHYATQLNQARAIAFAVERFRSQRPHCMGTIVWQLNDCWPVVSWAAVDGYGRRKPLWHALRRVYAEVLLTLQESGSGADLHIVNDGASEQRVDALVRRVGLDGELLAEQIVAVDVAASANAVIALTGELARPDADALLVVDVNGDRRSVLAFAEDRDLALAPCSIEVTPGSTSAEGQTLLLRATALARGVTLLPDVVRSDAWVDNSDLTLLPGETVELVLHSTVPFTAEQITAIPVRTVNALLAPAEVASC